MMMLAYILVILVGIAALVGTLMVAGKADVDYSKATKGNLKRILFMYIILGIIVIIGAIVVGIYLI
ncbi:MAG: hypothetical protein ACO1OT_09740 [Heyndrickxia sp.]